MADLAGRDIDDSNIHLPRRMKPDSKGARMPGLVLRSYRQAAGLSQRELARRVGVPWPLISLIENDRRRPSASLLHNIADILHIKAERLFLLSRSPSKLPTRKYLGSCTKTNKAIWRAFTHDNDLLARYQVQPNELRVLSKVRIMGELRHPRDFIVILTVIRETLKC